MAILIHGKNKYCNKCGALIRVPCSCGGKAFACTDCMNEGYFQEPCMCDKGIYMLIVPDNYPFRSNCYFDVHRDWSKCKRKQDEK
jgi:hypothetical protein